MFEDALITTSPYIYLQPSDSNGLQKFLSNFGMLHIDHQYNSMKTCLAQGKEDEAILSERYAATTLVVH